MLFIKPFKFSSQRKLSALLNFREEQQEYITEQNQRYNLPIITVNLNIPGIKKNKKKYWLFFQYYFSLLINELNNYYVLEDIIINYQKVNFAAILVINCSDSFKIKQELLMFEKKYSDVMQLFDLDVYDQKLNKISRSNFNYSLRKCFLCSQWAKECARQQRHSLKELKKYVKIIIDKEQNVSSWKTKFKK